MTPITERLAEALRAIAKRSREWNTVGHLGVAGIADAALAEYDRLRTHPAEGGEGRLITDEQLRDWEAQNELSGFTINDLRKLVATAPYATSRSKINDALEAVQSIPDCEARRYAERKLRSAMKAPPPQPVAPERGEAKAVTTCRICGKSSPRMTVCDSCDESSGPWGGTAVPRDLPNEPESSIHVEKPEPFTYAVVRKDVSPDFFMSLRAAEDAIASNNRTAKIVNLYATPQPPPAPTFRDPTIEDAERCALKPETLHSTSFGWRIEARWNCEGEIKDVAGQHITDKWREVNPIEAYEGVPIGNRFCMPQLKLTHTMGYSAAQALRWWLHAIADASSEGYLLETRLKKYEIVLDVQHKAVDTGHEVLTGECRA